MNTKTMFGFSSAVPKEEKTNIMQTIRKSNVKIFFIVFSFFTIIFPNYGGLHQRSQSLVYAEKTLEEGGDNLYLVRPVGGRRLPG
jgi:hypothetical protein